MEEPGRLSSERVRCDGPFGEHVSVNDLVEETGGEPMSLLHLDQTGARIGLRNDPGTAQEFQWEKSPSETERMLRFDCGESEPSD